MVKNIKKSTQMLVFSLKLINSSKKSTLIFTNILNVFLAIFPFLLVQINGKVINGVEQKNIEKVILYFILMLLVTCLNNVFTNIFSYKLVSYQYDLNLRVQDNIICKSQKIKYEKFENSELYDKLKRASENAATQPYELYIVSLQLIRNIIQFIYVVILLINSKIPGIFLFFLAAGLLVFPNFSFIKKEYQLQKELAIRFRKKNYFKNLIETIPSVKEVRVFQNANLFRQRFRSEGLSINERIIDYGKKRNILEGLCTITIFLLASVYQFFCIKNTVKGIYSIGEMSVYIQIISKVNGVITDTLSSVYEIYKKSLFIEHLYDYLNLGEETSNQELFVRQIIKSKNNILKFENVNFKYPSGQHNAISNLSFSISQGELMAIVGRNGSGKSTIINLICRLYEPQSGEILINDVPIKKICLDEWRALLKVTFQDFIKYEFSLKENILLNQEYKASFFEYLTQMLSIDKIAEKLPNGIDSQIGVIFDNGTQLSQGEWQKIAVCRSLYKNGKILILDEPSSALDKQTEENLFKIVKQMLEEKRILFALIITHNFTNLQYADKILKLD